MKTKWKHNHRVYRKGSDVEVRVTWNHLPAGMYNEGKNEERPTDSPDGMKHAVCPDRN